MNCEERKRTKSSGFYMQVYIIVYITETCLYHNSLFFICVAFIVDINGLNEITLMTLNFCWVWGGTSCEPGNLCPANYFLG